MEVEEKMGLIGRNGVITIATIAVGSCKNISMDISAEKLKEYVMGNANPDSLDYGNRSYNFSLEKLFVDSTHIDQILAGTVVAVKFSPEGITAGKRKYTINSAVLDKVSVKQAQNGYIMHNVTGEGMSISIDSA